MAEKDTAIVYNTDVFSLHRRINRFIFEVIKSQSSGISQTMPFDVVRVLSYLDSLEAYLKWVTDQPLLDLPETGPMAMSLLPNTVLPAMENESAYDICVLLAVLRDELANSQSARMSTNLIGYDYKRASAIIEKIRKFVTVYIGKSEPLDLPESSPLVAVTGEGRGGV